MALMPCHASADSPVRTAVLPEICGRLALPSSMTSKPDSTQTCCCTALIGASCGGVEHQRWNTSAFQNTGRRLQRFEIVLVERHVKHALYGKYLRRSTKLHAHDEDNACKEGDLVRVTECRPLSKTKNWRVVEIITRAAQ